MPKFRSNQQSEKRPDLRISDGLANHWMWTSPRGRFAGTAGRPGYCRVGLGFSLGEPYFRIRCNAVRSARVTVIGSAIQLLFPRCYQRHGTRFLSNNLYRFPLEERSLCRILSYLLL